MNAIISKKHHRIPRVYMKEWCITENNTVHTFNKKTNKFEDRNIKSIFTTNHYNSYTPGSINNPKRVNKYFFKYLDDYTVIYNGKQLKYPNQFNKHFNDFDNWEIKNSTGKIITKTEKNNLKNTIFNSKDDYIESKFSQKFESPWNNYVDNLYNTLIHEKDVNYEALYIYVFLFLYRNPYGDQYWQNPLLKQLTSLLEEFVDNNIPVNNRIYLSDSTVIEEIIHESNLRRYKELINNNGAIKKITERFKLLAISEFYIDDYSRFITSDTNVFYENNYLYFVISPKIFVKIFSKQLVGEDYQRRHNCNYDIKTISEINKLIFSHAQDKVLFKFLMDMPL